ncbi:hypothetical protein RCCGEPOP_18018 [Rhizobium sp. Pop5]|nr:hypothetical protein RCCGEPOP_18018 [Rhizobium sp. Pop5]
MRIFLIMLAAIALITGAWTFIRFKTAGNTWEAAYDCDDRGPLSDNEYIRAAVAQSIKPSARSPYYLQSSKLKSNYNFADKFIAENPGCCSIYRGDPQDYFSPETFEQFLTRTVARVVKINFTKENLSNGVYVGNPASHYVKLDACANQLD